MSKKKKKTLPQLENHSQISHYINFLCDILIRNYSSSTSSQGQQILVLPIELKVNANKENIMEMNNSRQYSNSPHWSVS